MKRLLLALCILTAFTLQAQTLKLGMMTPFPSRDDDRLYNLGSQLQMMLKNDGYDNFAVYTAQGTNLPKFLRLAQEDAIDIVITDYYQSAVLSKQAGYTPVFTVRKDGSLYEASVFITLKDSGIYRLKDLAGKKLALTYDSSATGSYLPLNMLSAAGIPAEKIREDQTPKAQTAGFFYSGTEQDAALAVYLRKADAGAISEYGFNNLLPDIYRPSLRAAVKSESVYALFIMLNNKITPKQKNAVVNALKNIQATEKGRKILESLNIDGLYAIGFDWKTLFGFIRQ